MNLIQFDMLFKVEGYLVSISGYLEVIFLL